MDFLSFKQKYKSSFEKEFGRHATERAFLLWMYRKVLTGTYYDILPYPFSMQRNETYSPNGSNQSIGMSQKRPSVKSQLSSVVVEDAVSFLFDESHFPTIKLEDDALDSDINYLILNSKLNLAMIEAATDGSVGSAALLVKLIDGKFYYESLLTEYCQPVFHESNPDTLESLSQVFKIHGQELIARGYANIDACEAYFYKRAWTENEEIIYFPLSEKEYLATESFYFSRNFADIDNRIKNPGTNSSAEWIKDESRSTHHQLGVVPIIWAKNLPGSLEGIYNNGIDGACTFAKAIDTNTELDYQLSQCGRGLKYSSEPILLVKDNSFNENIVIDKENGGVIYGNENTDAKMIEINGQACKAVIEYAQLLREIALENIHGNRSSAKKSSFAQSGKALEMYSHPVILLAGLLRISYGEGMLKSVINLMLLMMSKNSFYIEDKLTAPKVNCTEQSIALTWPQWFENGPDEEEKTTNTTIAAKVGGLISQATAIKKVADQFGVLNIQEELEEIQKEQTEFQANVQPKVVENIKV